MDGAVVNNSTFTFSVSKMEIEGGDYEDEASDDGINHSIINAVRPRPQLWNPAHKWYKDTVFKKRSWEEVAVALGVEEAFVKTRWRSLRDRYMKERRRENSLASTGESHKYKPWYMVPNLDFLKGLSLRTCSEANSRPPKILTQKVGKRPKSLLLPQTANPVDPNANQAVQGGRQAQQNVPTLLIISNPENDAQNQSLQGTPQMQQHKLPPLSFRRIRPAPQHTNRPITVTIPATPTIAAPSQSTVLAPPQNTATPDTLQPSTEPDMSSEKYFYLSVAKEMERMSTKARLQMRKIVSDALLRLYEEDPSEAEAAASSPQCPQ